MLLARSGSGHDIESFAIRIRESGVTADSHFPSGEIMVTLVPSIAKSVSSLLFPPRPP